MLSRAIYNFRRINSSDKPIIFDRGIPDMIGYAKLFEVDTSSSLKASKLYKYNKKVFFLPSWHEIYSNDEDRTMSFEVAKDFGVLIRNAYIDLGYEVVDVPLVDIDKRVNFITDNL